MSKSSLSRRDFLKLTGGAVGVSTLSYYLGFRNQPGPDPKVDAPDYIDLGSGFPVFRGPYLQKNAQLAAFLFPADLAALTEFCDQTLNAVPDSPFEYVPLMSSLLVVYADMLVSSMDERDSRVGLIPETEVGFWLLTVAMQKTATGRLPHHLAWFIPYLLVDENNAIATGREVYGFNKQAASFKKVQDIQSPHFSAEVLGFEHFAPDAIARKERLLEVSSAAGQASLGQWNDWETAKSNLSDMLLPEVRSDLDDEIIAFAAQAALGNIPLVFLKQFRDATQPQKACYQAIVEAPLQIQTFHGGGFFSQPGEMSLHPLESHPLAQRLGVQENQTSSMGAWLKVDFTLGLGVEYPLI
ncbi:MAG: hypothetical protein CVU44_08520 [Chloroflexi bacterium HGW-Chloroflexi-6]|nr:MAG: hypothetical protein CVU44_08520 [Chloroflexi bacterium HGW-Chloroflexi-6]